MPGPLDFAFLALFAVAWPLWTMLRDWPAYLRRLAAGAPNVRRTMYWRWVLEQWTLAAILAVLWVRAQRPWAALGFQVPGGWRLAVGLVLMAAAVVLYVQQVRAIATSAAKRARLRPKVARLSGLLPHTNDELAGFLALSVTAGVVEELLFRGFFVWVLSPWLTWWGAAAVSSAAFGLAHAYQGKTEPPRIAIVGLVFALIYGLTGSLLPCMVLHAAMDIGGGLMTWLAMREPGSPPIASASASSA